MKRLITPTALALLLCGTVAMAATAPKTTQQKLSYSMGVMTGKAFKAHAIDINPQVFAQGLADGYTGNKTQMTDEQIRQTLANFQRQSMKKMQIKMKEVGQENAQKGQAFLTTNKSKPGVKAFDSGLQYKVIETGKGNSPVLKDTVTVNYEGRLINGKVFDSSYKRGKPATFPVSGVIKGWQQALTHMRPGDTWEIYVPANLAYGERGAPGLIGPNEVLIFKVNLISIKKK